MNFSTNNDLRDKAKSLFSPQSAPQPIFRPIILQNTVPNLSPKTQYYPSPSRTQPISFDGSWESPSRSDPPAPEDVQEIIAPLPLPSQLPVIHLPQRVEVNPTVPTILPASPSGLVVTQGTMNGVGRTASFILPPSVIIHQ